MPLVESVVGKGSVFTVILPIRGPAAQAPEQTAEIDEFPPLQEAV